MKNHSQVIMPESNKHRSRLIKAIQSINLEDYSTPPKGKWGCTAIIECNGVKIKSTELDFEFNIPFDDNLEADEGEIVIYNLANSTKNALTAGSIITIKAGYNDDIGTLFKGTIKKATTRREGADRATTIKVLDDIVKITISELYESGKLAETTYSGATASGILTDLLKAAQKAGSCESYEFPTPPHDYTYDSDVTLDGDLETEIRTYAEECGVSVFKVLNTIYALNISGDGADISGEEPIELSEDTGLIGSPEEFEEVVTTEGYEDTYKGVTAEMLLNHTIKATRQIRLKSEQHNGTYAIKSGSHSFDKTTCITKITAIQKFSYSQIEKEEE